MLMYRVGDRSELYQIAVKVEGNRFIRAVLCLLEHQKELQKTGLTG